MNEKNLKRMNLASLVTTSAVGLAVGILLVFQADKLFGLLAVLLGIVGLVVSLPPFLEALSHNGEKGAAGGMILYGIAALLSLALIFTRNFVMMMIVGICLILIPVIRVSMAEDSMGQLRREFPRILIGVVFLLVGPCRVVDWLFRGIGIFVILLTVAYFLTGLVQYFGKLGKAESVTRGTRTFADTTGDGKVDSILIDTTGDGKIDTKLPYHKRDRK